MKKLSKPQEIASHGCSVLMHAAHRDSRGTLRSWLYFCIKAPLRKMNHLTDDLNRKNIGLAEVVTSTHTLQEIA